MLVEYAACWALLAGSALAQRPNYVKKHFPDCESGPLSKIAICNKSLSPVARAKALVSAMNETEKIANMQHDVPGSDRIGLPAYNWWNEALHGVAKSRGINFTASGDYSFATSFPLPIILGAAFDDDLVNAIAKVVSTEARAFSNGGLAGLDFWTPNINPYRDPRWGRGSETPGEDPFHASQYVKSLIPGLQGEPGDPYMKVAATCKHFAGYDLELWNGIARYSFDAKIKPQDMRDFYLPAFQACARDSSVQSVMCAYNAVNGVPSCASSYLLQTILKEHWNWANEDRFIAGDCDAVHNIFDGESWNKPRIGHNYTKTPEEAAAVALNAGTDLSCGDYYPLYLQGAIDKGLTNVSTMDQALTRKYATLVKLGYFDSAANQPYRKLTFADVSIPSAQALALKAAEEGIVLLKNDGTLPLKSTIKKLALIGPHANATEEMQGLYFGVAPFLHSPLYAAKKAGYEVSYVLGTNVTSDTSGYAEALKAAQNADAIIYVGGIDTTVEKETMDRYQISWPQNQLDLISRLSSLSKPLVVVQMGSMVDSQSLLSNDNVHSLVWAGYPGQDGGTAIFNILTGKAAPAGRLPVTQYPASYVDEVPMTNMSLLQYHSPDKTLNNPGRTYKYYTGKPVFPFGHGLYYTEFNVTKHVPAPATTPNSGYHISDLISTAKLANKPKYLDQIPFISIPVTVKNVGKVTSDYVSLFFISGAFGPQPYPKKSLVAYHRVKNLAAGQSSTFNITLTLASLARADEHGNLVLYPGQYQLQENISEGYGGSWDFTLIGSPATLEVWPKDPKGH
ncbi:related to beta-xylosidase [Rhynchosporium graminicola]|uniref:xylan 1,4-beta-xylosidase n=1 Tax=Rhynchosporium graminicola TaxID=2792576 RepID=A0A1E1LAY8_9HELO|nr:related to beta-xylosidase [Rhynchosporium commune]